MTYTSRILEILRANPEGATATDIARIMAADPRARSYNETRNIINSKLRALERAGQVERGTATREGSGPHTINLWKVVD